MYSEIKMDRIKYLLAVTAMSSLFSCSGDDMSDINVDVNSNGNSEFAIQLSGRSSSMSAGSRAAILDNNAGLQGIGVWCVAKNNNDATTGSTGMDWFGTGAGPVSCLIKNQKADIEAETGNVKWVPAESRPVYYYPITQTYKYEFYATYPYIENEITTADTAPETGDYLTYTQNGTRVTATYYIDGTQDILWGRATSDEKYAWSARYFRLNGGVTDDNIPNLQMEHMLTRLVFYVTPGADGSADDGTGSQYKEACKMTVTSLTIKEAINKLNLVVADNATERDLDARLTRFSPMSVADFNLKNSEGDAAAEVPVADCYAEAEGSNPTYTITPQQWGESIMLVPAQEYKVYMTMKMTDDSGTERTFETEIPLKLSGDAPFERGKSYNVTITVYHPTEIEAKATISDWVEETGPGLEF